ncbi:MAG TPA: hypothetical protein VIJ68_01170 [Candidatus Saccharimonadales bacterium]
MRANQVVDNLPEFTPALMDIAGVSRLSPRIGEGIEGFAEDLEGLGALPEFERTALGRVIPVHAGLNASPRGAANLGTNEHGEAYGIMDVHAGIRSALVQGVHALQHLTGYGLELGGADTRRTGRAVKEFAGFAIIRATQVGHGGWRRSRGRSDFDGEGIYIAKNRASYETLRPLMTRDFRRLADHAIASHGRS